MDKIKKHPFIRYYLKQEAQYPVAAQVIRHVIGSAYGSPGEEGCWKININETTLAINIFDLSGDEDYKIVRQPYLIDAIGVVLVFDVSLKITFDSLSKWEKEAESNGLDLKKAVTIVIGNKSDSKKRVKKLFIKKQ